MTTIGIGQLRSDTRRYVERAQSGETFRVLRRGRPVAQLCAQPPRGSMLVAVSLHDIRTRPGQFFDRVATGEAIAIEYNGRAVATLQPLTMS